MCTCVRACVHDICTPFLQVDLADGHNQIQLDWSGKAKSDTIVVLGTQATKSSTLHISHNYGLHFDIVTLNVSDTLPQPARLDYFLRGPLTYNLVSIFMMWKSIRCIS